MLNSCPISGLILKLRREYYRRRDYNQKVKKTFVPLASNRWDGCCIAETHYTGLQPTARA